MQCPSRLPAALCLLAALQFPARAAADPLVFHARSRVAVQSDRGAYRVESSRLEWDPRKTAIVICDMWDRHWCQGASARVAEMAPRLNETVKAARRQGVFVIHCPSDTLKFYEGTPQRKLAQAAPKSPALHWAAIDSNREASLPIDDTDGGCDDSPPCKNSRAWTRQIETIEIAEGDAITDSAEVYGLMQARGIENVLILGVHLNMCVLGRPFGIRQLIKQGQRVLLVRDLTDTMYNSRQRPNLSHFAGTDLMIDHVEKFWCPTITSADLSGGTPFRFKADRRPHVVMLIGEDEYKTAETLPQFALHELVMRNIRVTLLPDLTKDQGNFAGLSEILPGADLLLVSARRRALPTAQLDTIRAHLDAGRPLVGIRTASHAFAPRGADREALGDRGGRAEWARFDSEVLGGNYVGHHGNGPRVVLRTAPGAGNHPNLAGVDLTAFESVGSLYRTSPLAGSTTLLLVGSIPDKASEPVAWVNVYGPKQARVFYTSLGHPEDFDSPVFRRLLSNGIQWALDLRPAAAASD